MGRFEPLSDKCIGWYLIGFPKVKVNQIYSKSQYVSSKDCMTVANQHGMFGRSEPMRASLVVHESQPVTTQETE